jgi:hypothetical protein
MPGPARINPENRKPIAVAVNAPALEYCAGSSDDLAILPKERRGSRKR